MEVIRHTLDEQIDIPNSLKRELSDKKFCFIDIETTGFSRKYNYIILIGILYAENSKIEVIQLFADNKKDEHNLLRRFINYIVDFDAIISFNGDAFDIPFINSRLQENNIGYEIDKKLSLDILKVIRSKKDLLGLEKCNLKSIEKALDINREDTISGKESVELYSEYVNSKNNNIKEIILRHNYEDIYNLPKILKIFDIIEDKSVIKFSIDFLNHIINISIDVENINHKGNILYIEGTTDTSKFEDEVHYGTTYTFKWYPQTGIFQIGLEIKDGKLSDGSKCMYFDSRKFNINIGEVNKKNYNLPDNIIILKHNGNFVVDNIELLARCIWQEFKIIN
ncbi:hypothetical protein DW1_1093 [Proteiniborus sp. DW1]|uniref:ribonuclease H-like domain-containing protein n=1 Tax=Proteiniborus sp. DW1 TaxID=1889883 RepID=UPI00092DFCCD|nr:ribonuclease H-like domain-containing protein [Proteiniborus sp. DW1]SCG82666.1 hypothetical protein DW1_1093 [Proteiniborus sp. DW1]